MLIFVSMNLQEIRLEVSCHSVRHGCGVVPRFGK